MRDGGNSLSSMCLAVNLGEAHTYTPSTKWTMPLMSVAGDIDEHKRYNSFLPVGPVDGDAVAGVPRIAMCMWLLILHTSRMLWRDFLPTKQSNAEMLSQ